MRESVLAKLSSFDSFNFAHAWCYFFIFPLHSTVWSVDHRLTEKFAQPHSIRVPSHGKRALSLRKRPPWRYSFLQKLWIAWYLRQMLLYEQFRMSGCQSDDRAENSESVGWALFCLLWCLEWSLVTAMLGFHYPQGLSLHTEVYRKCLEKVVLPCFKWWLLEEPISYIRTFHIY